MSQEIRIVEVGPRDGLQNEINPVSTEDKFSLIQRLSQTGLECIEMTSFVHPRAIPQLKDAKALLELFQQNNVPYTGPVLVPNLKGLERALEMNVKSIAVFIAASETFSQRNTNRSIAESLEQTQAVIKEARSQGINRIRGYVSTCFYCPYEGKIEPEKAIKVCRKLYNMGIDELVVSDTIGKAVPGHVSSLLQELTKQVPVEQIALHFHDTFGTALANVWAGLQAGVKTFDSSIAGLGGCPYAPGARGNLATEKLVFFLQSSGIDTGVSLSELGAVASWISSKLGRNWEGQVLCEV